MILRSTFLLAVLGAAWAQDPPPDPVRIHLAASRGEIIPQSKGGGGFQRTFRFTAKPGRAGRWIRQVLKVRGTVFTAKGATDPAHLDVVEYYRISTTGRAIQADSHYSQFWAYCGGDITISATLTYGTLERIKVGDTILSKSFILSSATDTGGKPVTMKKRINGEIIPAERGKRVRFELDPGSIPTTYEYRVRWDARPGSGRRTQPSGEIEVGTWRVVAPEGTGHTSASDRIRPIPRIKKRR